MGKPKALVTRPLFPAARAILDQNFDVEYWTRPERIPRAELLKRVAEKDALVVLLTEKVDDELLSAAPKLRLVATVSVGYDNIDLPACTRRKVIATNTPGVLDETTADFAWTLLMAIARRLVEGDAWIRTGTWPGWDLDQLLGGDVWGKTLGVIGFGRIGRGVARKVFRCASSTTTRRASRPTSKRNYGRSSWDWTIFCTKLISSRCTCRCSPRLAI